MTEEQRADGLRYRLITIDMELGNSFQSLQPLKVSHCRRRAQVFLGGRLRCVNFASMLCVLFGASP